MFPLASLVVRDWCFLVGLWPCTPCRVSISVMLGMVIKGRWLFINDRHILSQWGHKYKDKNTDKGKDKDKEKDKDKDKPHNTNFFSAY